MDKVNKELRRSAANTRRKKLLQTAWRMRWLYVMILIPMAFIAVFNYAPMYGVVIAFKKFRYVDGIIKSPWYGFGHFERLFNDILFSRAFWNTIKISISSLVVGFPLPIILALLLNELKSARFKRIVQTVTYLPHFMSWVIISGFVYQLLSPEVGVINALIEMFGGEPIFFMSKKEWFLPVFLIASNWAGVGWGSIIYLASMSSIDPELYESAELDGANRLHKAIYITLPGIAPVVTIQLILSTSSIMSVGLDPILNLSNVMIMEVTDTINYFSYRAGIEGAKYDYAAAIGLFQNVVGLAMVLITNKVASRISEYTIW